MLSLSDFWSCNELAVADKGDGLSQQIFYEAGVYLAKHIVGLLPRVDQV